MNQSNALTQLENILETAVETGNPDELAGIVILKTMGLPLAPEHLVAFYGVLDKAYIEAQSLEYLKKHHRFLKVLKELKTKFIEIHTWNAKWVHYFNYIDSTNSLNSIQTLAVARQQLNPTVALDEKFLQELYRDLESLYKQIYESDLSQKTKKTLLIKLTTILESIRHYNVGGTEGIQQAAKAALFDLDAEENQITKEEKNNPLVKRFKSSAIILGSWFYAATIEFIPAIDNYWIPKFQDYLDTREKVEQIDDVESSPVKSYKKALPIINEEKMKAISGKEVLALPPSTDNVENKTDIEINPDGEINP